MSHIKPETLLELINKISFFDKFSPSEKKTFSSIDCQALRYSSGEQIIREGDMEFSLCILLNGEVRVTKNIGDAHDPAKKREAFLTTLKPVSVFGEISLLANRPRTSNAYAEGETVVMKITGDALNKLDPSAQNRVHRTLVELLIQRLEEMNKQLIKITS